MIKLDFPTLIALLLSLPLLLVFILWITYTYKREEDFKESSYLNQCPFCTYVFLNFKTKDLGICPHCQSYINLSSKARPILGKEKTNKC